MRLFDLNNQLTANLSTTVSRLVVRAFLLCIMLVVFFKVTELNKQYKVNLSQEKALLTWLNTLPNKNKSKEELLNLIKDKPLATVVSDSAQRFQLTIDRLTPKGNTVVICSLYDTEFDTTIKWLDAINRDYPSIQIESINISRSRGDVSTLVNVNLTLSI